MRRDQGRIVTADTLRFVTINFWGNEPPLDDRLQLAELQLGQLAPDVIAMQEVRPIDGRSGRTTADVLAGALGMNVVHEVALEWEDDAFHAGHPGGQEGLAILSAYPIGEHRVTRLPEPRPTESRILLSARIDTPMGPTWCHCTHLHYRLHDGLARAQQVVAIDDVLRGIETDQPQILGGDFNASPDADEMRFLRGLCTFGGRRTHYQDAWLRCHPGDPGLTWSSANKRTLPLHFLDIDRRIDYVFVTTRKRDGRGTIRSAEVVLREFRGAAASDHYGVLAEVQIAPTAPA